MAIDQALETRIRRKELTHPEPVGATILPVNYFRELVGIDLAIVALSKFPHVNSTSPIDINFDHEGEAKG